MSRQKTVLVVVICIFVLLNSCAVGQKVRYHNATLEINASGNTSIAVVSLDARSYVESGEKDKSYVGTLRGGFGNPFDMNTESGKPFADDLTSVICESLKKKGFICTPLSVEPRESTASIINKLKATNANRLILVTVGEWHTDKFMNMTLFYDVTLKVMDNQGTRLAEKRLKGEDNLGSEWNQGYWEDTIPAAYKKKLELLLNDPLIIIALK